MGPEHQGCYILRATANIDGEEYLCDFVIEWLPTEELRFHYDPEGDELIEQVNTFLAAIPYGSELSVCVDIPAGVYSCSQESGADVC